MDRREIQCTIQRRESPKSEPYDQSYLVRTNSFQTVLQLLQNVYNEHDSTLSFRFSCRTGLCSTCTVKINDKPKLTCMTLLKDVEGNELRLSPVSEKRVIRDLFMK
jgi:succinate dehydrogenase/fumarate reductase-like Fe-S protein